jgi:paired amphipathic helix protein Sin3a
MYLKSLDHMGIHVKQADKKTFTPKHLVDSIKTKYEEQKRQRTTRGKGPKYQFSYIFDDQEVLADLLRLMMLYATNSAQHNPNERRRIFEFFEKFVTMFFDIPEELVNKRTGDIDRGTPEDDYDDMTPSELPNGRGRRPVNGKKNDLRRGVLDKGRNGARSREQKADSATGSKESTPDVESLGEEDVDPADDIAAQQVTNERWAAAPGPVAVQGTKPLNAEDLELNADKPYKRESYSLYCNQTIYVFFNIFQSLYQRLKDIKDGEGDVIAEEKRARADKPAKMIGLLDDMLDVFGLEQGETYYRSAMILVEDFLINDVDEPKYQDILRQRYLKKGWQLYTVADLLKHLCRYGATCSAIDAKEKTPDLLDQFYKDRSSPQTSFTAEINLRKQADKYIKDGELFLIKWVCESFISLGVMERQL